MVGDVEEGQQVFPVFYDEVDCGFGSAESEALPGVEEISVLFELGHVFAATHVEVGGQLGLRAIFLLIPIPLQHQVLIRLSHSRKITQHLLRIRILDTVHIPHIRTLLYRVAWFDILFQNLMLSVLIYPENVHGFLGAVR